MMLCAKDQVLSSYFLNSSHTIEFLNISHILERQILWRPSFDSEEAKHYQGTHDLAKTTMMVTISTLHVIKRIVLLKDSIGKKSNGLSNSFSMNSTFMKPVTLRMAARLAGPNTNVLQRYSDQIYDQWNAVKGDHDRTGSCCLVPHRMYPVHILYTPNPEAN
ncbi:hypothetical protein O181_092419 [Austropuccinia psidii MF-1]|uniref:Uncharacterized protein n=1 Tax=Austropuccinia psidii MF-1 TaxID=1389203 RepID=A0A9Q3IZ82_9BASI|nr:hypothetical protein [Austropuccinia psidii MF-1]